MLQFLAPIWLYTSTAVALPLLIHLWNLRKGKRLKIGSLLLITQSIQPTARQIRLTEWLLLLLRCLLIILIALLLSGPYWQQKTVTGDQKGWVMIPRESVSNIYPVFKTRIDSLLQQGYELHAFNFPFETINTNTDNHTAGRAVSYWRTLSQLDNRLPGGFPVVIFSEADMDHFRGNRPDVSLQVQWHTKNETTRANTLVGATKLGNDSVALRFAMSQSDKNSFAIQHTHKNASIPGLRMLQTGNGRFVQWQQQAPIMIDTNTLRITVYQKTQQQDARYLTAALEAIRPMLDKPLQVSQAKEAGFIRNNQDWVFWLSDEPITNIRPGTNYFVYATGEISNTTTNILLAKNTSADPASFELYKRVNNNADAQAIWKDGFGHSLLTSSPNNIYRFYSRFDPSWNNLVWQAAFPELVFGLIYNDRVHTMIDHRQIDTAQLSLPVITDKTKTTNTADQTDLSAICWWLLLLIIAAERWVSLHARTRTRAA